MQSFLCVFFSSMKQNNTKWANHIVCTESFWEFLYIYVYIKADTLGFTKLAVGLMPSIIIWQN